MGKDVIIACDFSSKAETLAFLDQFSGRKPYVKIGMELFYAEGPSIVREIKARGHQIFLDLKLHDIPNTVKKAMAVLSRLDVDMINLHAAGTRAMMEGALEGVTRPGRLSSFGDCGDPADVHQPNENAGGTADPQNDGGDRHGLCCQRGPGRIGWCGLLSHGGGKGP